MPDRTIEWGDPNDAGTKYRTQDDDPAGGGNFVVAEDTDGSTVLLQWNPTASQWEYGGPVDLGGNDLTSVGTATVDALEAEDVTSDKQNGVFVLDPNASDFGAAVNDILPDMSEGDTLKVPPVAYDSSTTATPSKEITIKGDHRFRTNAADSFPIITKQADVPVIEPDNGVGITMEGLRFGSDVADTSPAVRLHHRFSAEYLTFDGLDQDGMQIIHEQTGDNPTTSYFREIVGNVIGRDLIHLENTSGNATNLQPMHGHIRLARSVTRHAYYHDQGSGNNVTVQNASNCDDSVFWVNTTDSLYTVEYAENVPELFNWNGNFNTGRIGVLYSVTSVDNGGGDNALINYGSPGNGSFISRTTSQLDFTDTPVLIDDLRMNGNEYRIEGSENDDFFQFRRNNDWFMRLNEVDSRFVIGNGTEPESGGSGNGLVVTTPDGSDQYRIRVDNSGNVVTDGPL